VVESWFVVSGGDCIAIVVLRALFPSAHFDGMIVHVAVHTLLLRTTVSSSSSATATISATVEESSSSRCITDLVGYICSFGIFSYRIHTLFGYGAGRRCSRIWMVVSYESGRVVKICVFVVL
jgi:hypothetical protein